MDEKTKKEILGLLIKNERKKQGLTQDKLSSLINIDAKNLSNIERGNNFPAFNTFCKIVEVLEIEPNYLLNFIEFKKLKQNPIDLELFENFKSLSDKTKIKINELITTLRD